MKRYSSIIFVFFSLLMFSGCSDYFDVRPKSQVLVEQLFEKEDGFNDELLGVYKQLSSTSLYGKEMTFGFIEVLSQNYNLPVGSPYEEAKKYNYTDQTVKSTLNSIWSNMYTAIANLNVVLQYIDKDLSIFTADNYNTYKGEALALRAYLHLELLRMFAPAYTSNPSALAIPYVTTYGTTVTPQSTVAEALDLVIKDLEAAARLMVNDPDLNTSGSIRNSSCYRINYIAVNALLARAWQWKGDMDNALKYAKTVIDDPNVTYYSPWEPQGIFDGSEKRRWDRLFSYEMLFKLEVLELDEITNACFKEENTYLLTPTETQWKEMFEYDTKGYGTDYRYAKQWDLTTDNNPVFAKYWQFDGGDYSDIVPMIRRSEMYYIAAEASIKNGDIAEGVGYLNEVRSHRNIPSDLQDNLSKEDALEEVYKEFRKEMVGDGQLFFWYKRNGYTSIPGSSVPATSDVYVFPLPDNEKEFGNRK